MPSWSAQLFGVLVSSLSPPGPSASSSGGQTWLKVAQMVTDATQETGFISLKLQMFKMPSPLLCTLTKNLISPQDNRWEQVCEGGLDVVLLHPHPHWRTPCRAVLSDCSSGLPSAALH